MKLYTFLRSPNSRKVVAVARHLGIDLEIVPVDLSKNEQMDEAFIALNPNHKIPTLQDGDVVVWESNAIMQYLCACRPGNGLWPADPKAQADVCRWLYWQLSSLGRACDALAYERVVKGIYGLGGPDPAAEAQALEQFHEYARILDTQLATRDWVTGTTLTLADFALGAHFSVADRIGLPWEGYAAIGRWYRRLDALDAWRQSAPPD
jgi:glutathione S-transferase